MERGRWFVRAGMLIVLLGFFMPTMLVSCSGSSVGRSFSLSQLAESNSQPILYLLLAGALVAGIVSFLPYTNTDGQKSLLMIQIIAVGAGLLATVGSLISLNSQIREQGSGLFEVKPEYGAIVLVAGLVLFVVGWWEQWANMGRQPSQIYAPVIEENNQWAPEQAQQAHQGYEPPTLDVEEGIARPCVLESIRGAVPHQDIRVNCDNFTIGRSSENNLVIADPEVSRHHARLRYHEGTWFIQDTNSSSGLMVNGRKVPAKRLEPGDKIDIVNNQFVFRY